MSPPIRSATLPSPTWPIALGSIAGCATSAPASPPSGGERCTWRGLRPLQGVLGRGWWPTTSCRWPASNRDRAPAAPQPCNGDHLYPARLPVHVNRVLSRELLRQREMPSRNIQPTRLQPSIVLKNRSTQKQEYSKTGVLKNRRLWTRTRLARGVWMDAPSRCQCALQRGRQPPRHLLDASWRSPMTPSPGEPLQARRAHRAAEMALAISAGRHTAGANCACRSL